MVNHSRKIAKKHVLDCPSTDDTRNQITFLAKGHVKKLRSASFDNIIMPTNRQSCERRMSKNALIRLQPSTNAKTSSKAFEVFFAHYFSVRYRKLRLANSLKTVLQYVKFNSGNFCAETLRDEISACSNRLLISLKFPTYPTHLERRIEWEDSHRRAIIFCWA